MQYAIDREAIVKAIYQGEAQVVNQTIIGPDWMGMPELNMYKFDPNKAKQLLKEANWDSSRALQTLYVPGTKERDAYMPIIQQQFKDVGITMEIIPSEAAEATRRRNAGEFDMQQIGGGIFRQDPNVSGKYMETVELRAGRRQLRPLHEHRWTSCSRRAAPRPTGASARRSTPRPRRS